MYKVTVVLKDAGIHAPMRVVYHDIKGLNQLELSAVGLSVNVIVRDLLGEVVAMYCGPDVQVHVYRVG